MRKIGLYCHTLRHLKPIQFWYRFWFKVYKPAIPPAVVQTLRNAGMVWHPCQRNPSMLAPTTFDFLNDEKTLAFPRGWEDPNVSALWQYNVHYFDDLVADEAQSRTGFHGDLIEQWIADNTDRKGIGWQPYPSSLRIVNWIKWGLSGNEVDEKMSASLAQQAEFLSKQVEHHLQANHLWVNGKALVFAGAFFAEPESSKWLQNGLRLILKQIDIQILTDGGHFERSPLYHSIVVEDILDFIQLDRIYPGLLDKEFLAKCHEKIEDMLRWLSTMSFPNDHLSFFNDSVDGIAPKLSSIACYATELGCEAKLPTSPLSRVLGESGYVRLENAHAVIITDVGNIGPDYQPGHGHADTLSFEMSLLQHKFIVNSGIDRYGDSEQRLYQRGTAAHSTIEVDGEDSSEVWGGFRVARRAKPFNFSYSDSEDGLTVVCSHDGYMRLKGKPVHTRKWVLKDQSLTVMDCMSGEYSIAVGRFHLHPEVGVEQISGSSCRLLLSEAEVMLKVQGGNISIVKSTYHPEFGLSLENSCLLIELSEPSCISKFTWKET